MHAEGYPGRRYYAGCCSVGAIEDIASERAKWLFKCAYANPQPYSGIQTNQAVFLALLTPGDKILGLDLKAGGHLPRGSATITPRGARGGMILCNERVIAKEINATVAPRPGGGT